MRIDSLTSLRFFAAFAVLLHHMQIMETSPDPAVKSLYTVFHEGFSGVQFFYILSGFIISYSFAGRQRKGDASFSYFLFCRAARLFPLHWLTLAASIVMFYPWTDQPMVYYVRLMANFALLHAWSTDAYTFLSFNGVSWSISVEVFFYASFCLLVGLPTRVLAILLGAIVAVVAMQVFTPLPSGTVGMWVFYVNPIMRLADFLAGMIVYRAFVSLRLRAPTGTATAAEIAAIAGIAASVFIAPWVSGYWRLDLYYVPSMALAVFVFAHGAGYVSRALSWKPLVMLGDASFAFYMVHYLVIARYLEWEYEAFGSNAVVSNLEVVKLIAATTAISAAMAILLHRYYEKPIDKGLRRCWMKLRHPTFSDTMAPSPGE